MKLFRRKRALKKRCVYCMSLYGEDERYCPHCGLGADAVYRPQSVYALPPGVSVSQYRIGMNVSADGNSLRYVVWDEKKQNRCILREFYLPDSMMRSDDGKIYLSDPALQDQVQAEAKRFSDGAKNPIQENNTLYRICPYKNEAAALKKNVRHIGIDIASDSTIGARKGQQDTSAFCRMDQFGFAVMCDGMGGMNHGEWASQHCVQELMQNVTMFAQCREEMIPELLAAEIRLADRQIAGRTDENGNMLRSGTTLLCAVLRQNRFYYASVGDSRICLIQNGRIKPINQEHTLIVELMQLVKRGQITYQEAMANPQKEGLTSFIGVGEIAAMDIPKTPIVLASGDMVLLCSDGVYRALSEEELIQIAASSPGMQEAATKVIRAVDGKQLPHQDNATIVLIQYAEY
ncbi:MAG: serine/threonine-protein phosphatase [Lachnospiraceae bacterium]|nr:serine/threonine-protein phosphatase [Lachnospiraceae bacterium]